MRDRRVLIGAGAALAALLLLLAFARSGTDGIGPRLKAAVKARDTVPSGPVITSIPPGCGVSDEVRDRLAPQGEEGGLIYDPDTESCEWETGRIAWSLGGGNRKLEVKVSKELDRSPVATAMETFTRDLDGARGTTGQSKAGPPRRVTGLGDEAVALDTERSNVLDHRTQNAVVLFRGGNIVVRVDYGGADYSGGDGLSRPTENKPLSGETALNGALMAAADIAENLRLMPDATPALAKPAAEPPPLQKVPDACALLPAGEAKKLAPGAAPAPDRHPLLLDKDTEGVSLSACGWGLDLDMEIASVEDTPAGTGGTVAAREFLRKYHQSRHSGPIIRPRDVYFRPLEGPGDEAFIVFGRDEDGEDGRAQVLFRVRNVLVSAQYDVEDGGSRTKALDRAHAAALAAAKTLNL